MSEAFTLGIGRTVITPPVGTNLYGYRPDVISESVHDDLTATAFCFRQGETAALLISRKVSKKGLQPITLIAISAVLGIVVYGI